jgi:hypothetical protein
MAEVVRQGMELKANRVGDEGAAWQPRPDLLVMGAYRYSPIWKFIVGGTTPEILERTMIAVLMSPTPNRKLALSGPHKTQVSARVRACAHSDLADIEERERLVRNDILRRDLVGPGPQDDDLAREWLSENSSRWYLNFDGGGVAWGFAVYPVSFGNISCCEAVYFWPLQCCARHILFEQIEWSREEQDVFVRKPTGKVMMGNPPASFAQASGRKGMMLVVPTKVTIDPSAPKMPSLALQYPRKMRDPKIVSVVPRK